MATISATRPIRVTMTMKVLLTIFLLSLVWTESPAQGRDKKSMICTSNNIVRQTCNPAKAGGWCIPRVTGATFKWADVKSTSFIVRWNRVATAKCYYIEMLSGYTGLVHKTVSCYRGTVYKATGLIPWKVYGFRVSAVNRRCRRGRPSTPTLRIKAFWSPAAVVTTAPPRPTYSPKVGACGKNFFTCKSNSKECIPKRKYCNKILNCNDGSDERHCRGGCKEIDVKFNNGNYSCSRWGSPGSFCFFDCDDGYLRDGARFTRCSTNAKRWTNPLPTCRLQHTRIFRVLHEETTEESVTVEWEPVDHAIQYAFQAVEQVQEDNDGDSEEFTVNHAVNATVCCKAVISGFKPKVEYRMSMFAFDSNGLRGMESVPVFFRAERQNISIKSGE